jgi:hypothetical protein
MRKGIAGMYRRAEVSSQSNDRYADTLASLDTSTPIGTLAVCDSQKTRPWADG